MRKILNRLFYLFGYVPKKVTGGTLFLTPALSYDETLATAESLRQVFSGITTDWTPFKTSKGITP